jgi:hypothetical protein
VDAPGLHTPWPGTNTTMRDASSVEAQTTSLGCGHPATISSALWSSSSQWSFSSWRSWREDQRRRCRSWALTTISTLVHDSNVAPAVASEINDAIVAAVAAHPNLHVVDWNAAVHAAKGASLLIADRIHPSTAGDLTLAALDRAALDHDCRNN